MSPFRFLTIVRSLTFVCCSLACASWCQTTWADQQAAPEDNEAAKKDAPEEEEQAKKALAVKEPVFKKRAPLHELPALNPKRLHLPKHLLVPEAAAARKFAGKKPAKKKQAIKPAVRRPNAPFWSPRQSGLSAAAVYRLESMGRNVHLSPAMRFHLNRSRATTPIASHAHPSSASTSASNLPGRGTQQFYPGVSRLPTQKPFANLERPPTGFERYWPLLLEGRQDPNTGLIIWSLP